MRALFAKIYELRPGRPIVFSKANKVLHEFFVNNFDSINNLLNSKILIDGSGCYPTIPQLYELLDTWSFTLILRQSLLKHYSFRLAPEDCMENVPREFYNNNSEQLTELAQKFIKCLMRP